MEKIKVVVNRQSSIIRRWVKDNRLEAVILVTILLIGAFLRLYRISEYMTFLGDEGRDVIIVRRLLADFDLILVGPGTSIGNMYLGPIYYYMMAPALLLANFSPVGPAVFIALLGIATIFFIWYVAREWFCVQGSEPCIGGLIAAGLYAISPTVIIYSRSSWNPNIMPFFALLAIYSIWQFWFKRKFGWIVVSGLSFAIILQSHYLGLLIAPVIGFFWLLTLFAISKASSSRRRDKRQEIRIFVKKSAISLLIFLLLMSPLVIFDARHGWRNFAAINKFFTQRQTTVSARPWTAIPKLGPITEEISVRLITGTNEEAGKWTLGVIVVGLFLTGVIVSKKIKRKKEYAPYLLILVWIGFALVGLGVYKQEIYDHYYGFFFAAPFLLIGGIAEKLVKVGKGAGIIAVSL
ncbi:glycosyltransferase family 39 protein, partial [Patescibacteria group bacterium]|nr:glycosyltransferase family 39 protein [Patescibacteria group bacterium]